MLGVSESRLLTVMEYLFMGAGIRDARNGNLHVLTEDGEIRITSPGGEDLGLAKSDIPFLVDLVENMDEEHFLSEQARIVNRSGSSALRSGAMNL